MIFSMRATSSFAAAAFVFISGSSRLLVSSLSTTATTANHDAVASSTNTNILGARRLGNSDLVVSEACLGTMTFGVQNNYDDAAAQLDLSRSHGINFIDTAELYPVPLFANEWRAGATEEIIGNYISKIGSAARDELVIATKVAGYMPNSPVAAERTVPPSKTPYPDCRLDATSIKQACDASLRRLKTDRIDLLQLHWPDRYVPLFGQMEYDHNKIRGDAIQIEETASALRDLIEEGKVRAIGLSNETPFGVCEWVRVTEKLGIRNNLASIQNSYSLVDRRFDTDLAEVCSQYQIGLLPWSILAGGLLSGKYRTSSTTGTPSSKSRFMKYPDYMKRWSPTTASKATLMAVDEYAQIASKAGMSLTQMAIEFTRSRKFISDCGSVIVGATTIEQLEENLAPFAANNDGDESSPVLDEDILQAINQIHMKCRDPSCSL